MRFILRCEPQHLQQAATVAAAFVQAEKTDAIYTTGGDGEAPERTWYATTTKTGVSVQLVEEQPQEPA